MNRFKCPKTNKAISMRYSLRDSGAGLPNKKIADEVFNREQKSGKWDAVYMEKAQNGSLIDIKTWYKGTKKQ